MASQKIVFPAVPPSANANPLKMFCQYPKLDNSKQSWIGMNLDLEESETSRDARLRGSPRSSRFIQQHRVCRRDDRHSRAQGSRGNQPEH